MEKNMEKELETLHTAVERLAVVASQLESLLKRAAQDTPTKVEQDAGVDPDARQNKAGKPVEKGEVQKITASLEHEEDHAALLERRILATEQALASMQEASLRNKPGISTRKTVPTATVQLLAKQGIDGTQTMRVDDLDAALAGLSIEQRIAVKSQMLQTGALVP